jgi:hypothetical protein
MTRATTAAIGMALVASVAACRGAKAPIQASPSVAGATLWERPSDVATRDLYFGPWGRDYAPNPMDTYTFVERKHSGVNLGMTVVDSRGREWSVKQPYPGGMDDESPVEVVVSRILSAVGYHQPPVYYLPSFTLKDDWGTHIEPGGRFRLKLEAMNDVGTWRWEENPFIGSKPYQGLLVMLMMLNDTDLKNSNNTLYERHVGNRVERWYVVRDVGAALGDLNPIAPRKGDPESFEQTPFILGVDNRHVDLNVDGWYKKLVRDRITVDDVRWASALLAQLSERQWHDAFRAGGFEPGASNRFVRALRQKVADGQNVGGRATADGDRD